MEPREVRLHNLFQTYGKTIILPYDQGLEHGPQDFFNARHAENPFHIIDIAKKGRYNAVALHIGNAKRHFKDTYDQVPLVLKVNGKTGIPSDDEPLSPITATIDEALRLSAIAVGYTLYIGSPRQDEDFEQFTYVREEAHSAGLPVIVWSYPRGREIEEKGGKNSLCIRAGGSGFIFGRNIWQRPVDQALDITRKLKEVIRTQRQKKQR